MSDDGTLIFKRLGNLLREERRPLRAGKGTMSKTIDLDIPHDAATRVRREEEWNRKHRERIVEVLRKFGVRLEDAPLDALAMAMARINAPPHSEQETTVQSAQERVANLKRAFAEHDIPWPSPPHSEQGKER